MKTTTKLWFGLAVLIVLLPVGLWLPEYFKAGDAWGEWGIDRVKELVGYIPQGLERLSGFWKAPFPDYSINGWKGSGAALGYVLSGVFGVVAVVLVVALIGRFLARRRD